MLTDTPLDTQITAQRNDRLRVLIVGAGVAGITLAQLLRRDGLHPVLVDRMPEMNHPGYMLALMPTVDQAFVDLGVHDHYLAAGTPMERYAFRSHRGTMLRSDSMSDLLRVYGSYNGISRGALIDVLTESGCPVTFGTTVQQVIDRTARFVDRDGTSTGEAEFDLIVGADGIRSHMRSVLDSPAPQVVKTGWSGWVGWAEDLSDPTLGEEIWGNGFFLGAYPVNGRLGVFLGGPDADLSDGPAAFAASIRRRVDALGPRLEASLRAIEAAPDPYLWRLDDARAPRWVLPDGVLLGDAAAGFLPTAGIGAGMAIEAAWMLGRMLAHADRESLPTLLEAWERVERPRVEAAQSNSRMLARLMFRRGRVLAWLRETTLRRLSVRAVLGPIVKLVAGRPDPEAVARQALRGIRS
ncbi:NAD(P)/FAD-dependent oxidoreductase [Microbacterium esteraromaticum]|uniref:FAD-dependent oxidoreductase n=1 Tax=Microbacterium esteraromaticum TaxID=57043 RepID=UPI002368921A|nr:NAD(P)/FAD-dependent oxidoreductase [Microbacterium esteraromaticum]WDH78845.1 NAD(P)/FAD-dependent oxidoreductase [Microbacterium esteraromaticum]